MIRFLIFALTLFSFSSCTGIFFQPWSGQLLTPAELGIEFEDVWIESPGEPRLHAWYLPASNPIATLLHLHGNAENISTHLGSVYWMPKKGVSVLLVDYRGYGLSEGQATLEGLHKDIERATHYLRNRADVDQKKLILLGQSLGAAMALYSAAQPGMRGNFKAVIAESAFSGYRDIAKEKLASTWLTYPFQWFLPFLIQDNFSPLKTLKQIAPTPVLLIHGSSDHIVSIANSERICKELGNNCQFWRVENGAHIGGLNDSRLQSDLVEFIRKMSEPLQSNKS